MTERCSGVYREVARACGMDVARALHAHYAGGMIKVPRRVGPDHVLAQRLGFEAAQRLCAHFAGEQIEAPVRWLWGRELRLEVARLLAEGLSVNDVARELRTPRTHVHAIRKKMSSGAVGRDDEEPEPPRQMTLF